MKKLFLGIGAIAIVSVLLFWGIYGQVRYSEQSENVSRLEDNLGALQEIQSNFTDSYDPLEAEEQEASAQLEELQALFDEVSTRNSTLSGNLQSHYEIIVNLRQTLDRAEIALDCPFRSHKFSYETNDEMVKELQDFVRTFYGSPIDYEWDYIWTNAHAALHEVNVDDEEDGLVGYKFIVYYGDVREETNGVFFLNEVCWLDRQDTSDENASVADSQICGDIDMRKFEWSWYWYDKDKNIYSIFTAMLVDGSQECFFFDNYHEYDRLILTWDEGHTQEIFRTNEYRITKGFGPILCEDESCMIGAKFESNYVYDTFSQNEDLQLLFDRFGLPDEACAQVFNADLIELEFCSELKPATQGDGPIRG